MGGEYELYGWINGQLPTTKVVGLSGPGGDL